MPVPASICKCSFFFKNYVNHALFGYFPPSLSRYEITLKFDSNNIKSGFKNEYFDYY